MNKTIFNLSYNLSIIIVSLVGVIFAFLSNAFYVNGVVNYIIYVFRFLLFVGLFIVINIIEKKSLEFKEATKRMSGYLIVGSILNIIFAIFTTTHILKNLFLTLSGVVCFWIIVSFLIEILRLYFKNTVIEKVFLINEKIGSVLANPIFSLINSTND